MSAFLNSGSNPAAQNKLFYVSVLLRIVYNISPLWGTNTELLYIKGITGNK